MIKNYSIDLNYIYSLKEKIKSNPNFFKDDLIVIDNLISKLNGEKLTSEIDSYLLLENDAALNNMLNHLHGFVETFSCQGTFFDEPVNPRYQNIYISNNEVMEYAKAFFHEHGSFFYSPVCQFLSNSDGRIAFIKNKNTEGEVNVVKTTNDLFLIVPNHHNITKLSIAMHELEHIIDFSNNPNFLSNYFISEIASLFMEMIGCDWISDRGIGNKEETEKRKIFIYSIVKREAFDIIMKRQIIEIYNGLKDKSKESIDKALDEEEINPAYFKWAFSTSLLQNYYYQISFYIAVELYYIYNNNKKYALSILKDVILNGNDANIFFILEKYGIVLNANTLQYEDDIAKTLKI